jgi:hypothetical protein
LPIFVFRTPGTIRRDSSHRSAGAGKEIDAMTAQEFQALVALYEQALAQARRERPVIRTSR